MNQRLLLIKPPEPAAQFSFGAFSLAVLAAAVRDRTAVSILDATDLSMEQALAEVSARQPNLIGVTVMGHASVPAVGEFVRHVKAASPSVPLLVGGHGTSLGAEALLRAGADAAVLGEGERTLQHVLEHGIRPGHPGLACLSAEGDLVLGRAPLPIEPLGTLPLPARDLLAAPSGDVHLLETSRGCPHDCGFCEATRFYGRRWRPHMPERVAAEVRALVHEYGALIILVADDNFAADPRRVRRICQLLPEHDLPAFFMVSARADDLVRDPRLLPTMAQARMLRVCVGIESLDPEIAATAGKPVPPQIYRQVFARMRELGMFSIAALIVGLPGETLTGRARSVSRLLEVAPDAAQFLPFHPLPGTPLGKGYSSYEPKPADSADAAALTHAYQTHPVVQHRLREAATQGGVRGTLARGVLKKYPAPETAGHRAAPEE